MRPLLSLLTLLVAGCNCTPQCPELPDAAVLFEQPYGGPCDGDPSCQAGLRCLDYLESSRWKMCSTPCSKTVPCSDGASTCLSPQDGGPGLCLPPCTSDAMCTRGALRGRCAGGFCSFVQCSQDSSCPAESHCAGIYCVQDSQGFGLNGGYCRVNGT